jgi:hypothetical protein
MMAKEITLRQLVSHYRRKLTAMSRLRPKTEDWEKYPAFDKPPNQALADLEHTWQAIASEAGAPMLPSLAEFRSQARDWQTEHPLDALTLFVAQGHYPPPELLLTVLHLYQTYLDGNGELTLEECFFGNDKTRAGNHAARSAKRVRELTWTVEVALFGGEADEDTAVAEKIVKRDKLHMGAESILRAVRKHSMKVKEE